MMKTIKNILLTCTVCVVALNLNPSTRAEDSTISAAPVKAALAPPGYKGPVEYVGKVMVVNRPEQTITVEINEKLHLFKMNSQIRILKKGKPISLANVTAGQKISVVARSLDNGSLELVAVGLDTNLAEAQPAGREVSSKASAGDGRSGAGAPLDSKPGAQPKNLPPPFQGGYYPGNVQKVIVSPNN